MLSVGVNLSRLTERVLGPGIRRTDVFLVGYPKSGMTWMEFLLTYALFEKTFDDCVTFVTINDYIPNLAHIAPDDPLTLWHYRKRPAPRIFFTHTPYDPRLTHGKIIYMVRDARDVLVSYYHYHRLSKAGFNLTMRAFLLLDDYYPCRWDEHVRGWILDRDTRNTVVVHYRELKADAAGTLARVLKFIGAPFTFADIDRAVEMSKFQRMREVEEKKSPARVEGGDPNEFFVRKGKVEGWREELGEEEVRIIESRYGETMRQVGYPPVYVD